MSKKTYLPSVNSSETRIKALHIITLFSIGGATENTLLTVKGLMEDSRFQVDIISGPADELEGSMLNQAEELGVRVRFLPHLVRHINPLQDFIALIQLAGIIRREHYQIVHTHSSKAGVLGRLAAWLNRVPVIVHTIHGLPFHEYQSNWLNRLYIILEKICATVSHRIFSVSTILIDKGVAAGITLRENFALVRSGLPIEQLNRALDISQDRREEYGLPQDRLLIGMISRFSPLKGHEFLIQAIPEVVREFPDVLFVFAGDGQLQEQMQRLVADQDIQKNVRFLGLVPQHKVPEFIAVLDIVVHTSLLEGLARVLTQSLFLRKPVISYDIDGAPEVITDGENGFLIPPKDVRLLAERIKELAGNPELRKSFGTAGHLRIMDEFTDKRMVDSLKKHYLELLDS